MVPVSIMEVFFVVDEDGGIIACAYDDFCFNLLICWAIPARQVDLFGIQKQFLFLLSIVDWKHTWAPSDQWVYTDQLQRFGMGVQTN